MLVAKIVDGKRVECTHDDEKNAFIPFHFVIHLGRSENCLILMHAAQTILIILRTTALSSVYMNINTMCSSRKYPDPHPGGNRKFRRGGGVNGPGNSKGEGGFEAKFTSRWSGK